MMLIIWVMCYLPTPSFLTFLRPLLKYDLSRRGSHLSGSEEESKFLGSLAVKITLLLSITHFNYISNCQDISGTASILSMFQLFVRLVEYRVLNLMALHVFCDKQFWLNLNKYKLFNMLNLMSKPHCYLLSFSSINKTLHHFSLKNIFRLAFLLFLLFPGFQHICFSTKIQ